MSMSLNMTSGPDTFKMKSGAYDMPCMMTYGLPATREKMDAAHPLEISERNYDTRQERMQMRVLQATQGLHAPLRLQMERRAVQKAGGRLPFLHSERLAASVLADTDTTIQFSDVLNLPEYRESMGQPLAEMERAVGLL